jgi:hypothetical protein
MEKQLLKRICLRSDVLFVHVYFHGEESGLAVGSPSCTVLNVAGEINRYENETIT